MALPSSGTDAQFLRNMQNLGKELDKEVNRLVQPYQNLYNEQELEELKSKLYSISIQSERAGFILGVKWMMKLLLEIFMQ